jgi:hypothetical protein
MLPMNQLRTLPEAIIVVVLAAASTEQPGQAGAK